ncbi:class I SAM-dependent methyltransferase [Curtobacterium sp. MCPF17_046]|uniref:class I SAM-dependent methyltransferase n=1 Tax=Curtobacterium sp. MCPF17_046 TaxID=2175663 RepID=UPI000D876A73|nr:class I SAM-dependent methyltransferase [Curtobacterium sp. MCPF17_046]PYY39071.1 SAM-dependent methyltransferase [Curtobacterium sp. MCPF17_046]
MSTGSGADSGAVRDAYGRRAAEYTEQLGSMGSVHPADVHLVTSWATGLGGPVLDAGCGPGHWTGHLADRGVDVLGLDQVPAFVEHARRTHPSARFHLGSVDDVPAEDGHFAGVLAWYSLVHHDPVSIARPLSEAARVLRPGGGLLVGFFTGDRVEPFDHAVTTAYRWPPDALADAVRAAGFTVLEVHTRTVATTPGPRPHGALLAVR